MNPVVHFEMPYDDRRRMAKFHAQALGWRTEELGAAMGDHVLATTAGFGARGPVEPGAINGGFFPQEARLAGATASDRDRGR